LNFLNSCQILRKLRISLFLLSFIILFQTKLEAQIGSLSGTKIWSVSHNTLPQNILEFEPTFYTNRYNSEFDFWGNSKPLGEEVYESSISWRVSYGVYKNLEIGMTTTGNLEDVNIAMKYTLRDSSWINFGAMIGYTEELGNREIQQDDRRMNAFQLGLISTIVFDDKNSLDLNAQFEQTYVDNDNWSRWHLNADFGTYALHPNYQLILGVFHTYKFVGSTTYKTVLLPTISIEPSDKYALVFNLSKAVYGKKETNDLGFGVTLTLLLD